MQDRSGSWLRRTPEVQAESPPADGSAACDPGPEAGAPAPSRIELGWEIEGELRLEGPLLVLGDFRGAIHCGDVVTVADGGSVQGPIRARRVVIHGAVVGDVGATRDVVLHPSAKLHGDVETPSLVVERGAFFRGRSQMASPLARPPSQPGPEAPRQARPATA
jgi:cytoskeletal protein CcmA (bactofilin family)